MLSIAIDRFTARYRMPPRALREQPRVQRIVDDALARVLEGAIEREGIAPSGYVCIHDVRAVATVRLREPDAALAAGVGGAIAMAIRRMIEEGSPSVVQYGSRAHALVDLASSAIAGDFNRSWAWTQVGIWRSDFPLHADVTADLIVRALAKEATHAVAVATYLARERADRFGELIARATPRAWDALARAALLAAGGDGDPSARSTGRAGNPRDAIDRGAINRETIDRETIDREESDQDRRRGRALERLTRRIVTHSAVARVSIERFASAPAEIRRALAALALLEVEPAATRGGVDTAHLLKAIERAMEPAAAHLPETREARTPTADARVPEDDVVRLGEHGAADPAAGEPPESEARHSRRAPQDDATRRAPIVEDLRAESGEGSRADEQRVRDPHPTRLSTDAPQAADRRVDGVPDVRRLTRTGHGGLLYLVNLLPRIGLVETLRRDERWSDRGLRWVLHQLAMALAAIDAADPAALVFAGLAPDTPPPASLQDPPTDLERAVIDALRATIARALRDTLGGSTAPDAESDQALMDRVCGRPARIAAEPGWIEARFSLDDVAIDIRRAGLDLNPEWVPWLGIVLRFVYA